MKYSFNKDKMITIGILPIMWLIYFLFEVFSGRVNDLYTLTLNLSLILVFALSFIILILANIKYLRSQKMKGIVNEKRI